MNVLKLWLHSYKWRCASTIQFKRMPIPKLSNYDQSCDAINIPDDRQNVRLQAPHTRLFVLLVRHGSLNTVLPPKPPDFRASIGADVSEKNKMKQEFAPDPKSCRINSVIDRAVLIVTCLKLFWTKYLTNESKPSQIRGFTDFGYRWGMVLIFLFICCGGLWGYLQAWIALIYARVVVIHLKRHQ